MNRQIRRIDPSNISAGADVEDYTPRAAEIAWELIEDDAEAESEHDTRRTVDRRLCLIIAVMGAVVGFGFAGGHDSRDALAPGADGRGATGATDAADAPVALEIPADGATIEGATVDFAGVVRGTPGIVEVAVTLGGVIIGSTTITATEAGPIAGSVPVFAPPTAVQVELVATSDNAVSRRSLTLRPSGPLGLWPVAVTRTRGQTVVIVSGSAPLSVHRVSLRVTAHDTLVAECVADVGTSGSVAGSVGAASLGLGSFTAPVPLPDPVPAGPLKVEVAWRDDVNGSWGSSWLAVTGRSGDPHEPN